jgi:hypothetical protein
MTRLTDATDRCSIQLATKAIRDAILCELHDESMTTALEIEVSADGGVVNSVA